MTATEESPDSNWIAVVGNAHRFLREEGKVSQKINRLGGFGRFGKGETAR